MEWKKYGRKKKDGKYGGKFIAKYDFLKKNYVKSENPPDFAHV